MDGLVFLFSLEDSFRSPHTLFYHVRLSLSMKILFYFKVGVRVHDRTHTKRRCLWKLECWVSLEPELQVVAPLLIIWCRELQERCMRLTAEPALYF